LAKGEEQWRGLSERARGQPAQRPAASEVLSPSCVARTVLFPRSSPPPLSVDINPAGDSSIPKAAVEGDEEIFGEIRDRIAILRRAAGELTI